MKRSSLQASRRGFIRKFLPTLTLLVLGVIGLLYSQQIADMVLASSFHPTDRVNTLNARLKLTGEGTNLLYASRANIENKQEFNTNCQSSERTAAILGCYYKRQIHLFDVSNPELDGAIEVTAAHEMLHAAYERLNFFERAQVDKLIEAEYDNLRKDPTIAEEMAYYQKAEPGAEVNELHSIIGTTVAQISPELERYYSQYFKDRASVVALNQKYTAVFTELNKKAEELQAAISAKEPVIKQELADYDADRKQLEIDIQTFNERASSQGFTTQNSFNVSRNALVRRVNELNARRDMINAEVNSYNVMISDLTQLSVKVNQYNESLNGVEAASGV